MQTQQVQKSQSNKQIIKPYSKPQSLTERQEGFCKSVVLDKLSLSDAYRKNYATENMKPYTIFKEASRTANLPHVSSRIDHLRNNQVLKTAYDKEKATLEFEEVRQLAIEKGDLSNANSSIANKCKLHGLFEEKKTIVHQHEGFINLLRQEMEEESLIDQEDDNILELEEWDVID